MLSAFTNCLKIPELRNRIFFTVALIFIARVGANIPLPGIDSQPLQDFMDKQAESSGGSLLGFYNMFYRRCLAQGCGIRSRHYALHQCVHHYATSWCGCAVDCSSSTGR